MDLNAYFDPSVYHKIYTMAKIEVLRENTDPNTILIRAFVGAWKWNQSDPLEMAADEFMSKLTYTTEGALARQYVQVIIKRNRRNFKEYPRIF